MKLRPTRHVKERPLYRSIYQNELAEEITGRNISAIQKLMKRKEITLAQAIRYYLQEDAKTI